MSEDYQLKRDLMLDAQKHTVLFQENDWMIGDTKVNQNNHPDHPLINHYCNSIWNYVFSSEYAVRSFRGTCLYQCSNCEETAPDNIITIHSLMVK